jgi:DNA-binding NtrC family response regulator
VSALAGLGGRAPITHSVLVVDDDELFHLVLADALSGSAVTVVAARTCAEARERMADGFAVAIVDNRMPDGDGLALVPELLAADPRGKVIVCTGFAGFDNAVAALRLGVHDYLEKPVEMAVLRAAVQRCLRIAELEQIERVERYRREAGRAESRIVGESAATATLRSLVARAAQVRAPVLVTGETGTGKTLVAREIHLQGTPDRPFVHVNCAALPETLVEAELFGAERGAFTGASQAREGLFELADGGTLLFDEIGEVPAPIQAKLLTVLDDGCVRRVGAGRPRRVDVRVIAATNVDVELAVKRGALRADLYYRLNVIRIEVPPLRGRRGEIPDLAAHLLGNIPGGRSATLAAGEAERLAAYPWPGNTRELRNVLERAVFLQAPEPLRPSALLGLAPATPPGDLSLGEVERAHILATLDRLGGNRAHAARTLDVSVATLRRKLREYGVDEAPI